MSSSSYSYDRASRYRAGNGALFTSTKCPPPVVGSNQYDVGGLNCSCQLPFGFLYTPMAAISETTTTCHYDNNDQQQPNELPPILCTTCLAYMNLYATLDETNPGIWHCALCGSKNAASPHLLELHAQNNLLVSPLLEFRQALRRNNGVSSKAATAEAPLTLILVVDANLSNQEAHAIPQAVQQALSSTKRSIQLGLVVFDQHISVYQLGLSGMACADVFTIEDDGLTMEHLQTRDYLATLDDKESSSAWDRLNLCVSAAFGVSQDHGASQPTTTTGDHAMDLGTSSLNAPRSRLEILKQRKAERLRKQQQQRQESLVSSSSTVSESSSTSSVPTPAPVSPWIRARQTKRPSHHHHRDSSSSTHAYRATGEAIHTALNLTKATTLRRQPSHKPSPAEQGDEDNDTNAPNNTCRILLFTNGCPNYGDASVVEQQPSSSHYSHADSDHSPSMDSSVTLLGPDVVHPLKLARSIEFLDTLARSEPSVALDVLCTGSSELGIAAYQALVDPSGGYVLPHESFVVVDAASSLSLSIEHEKGRLDSAASATTQPLQHNLTFLLQHTYVSNVPSLAFDVGTGAAAEAFDIKDNSPDSLVPTGCIVDLRASPFLTATHLVGPGELLNNADQKSSRRGRGGTHLVLPNERAAFAKGSSYAAQHHGIATHHLPSQDFVQSTLTRLTVGRVDPLSTYSIMFRTNDSFGQALPDTSRGYAVFQCIARFVDPTGNYLVTRVATHRLAIAKDVGEFLENMDEEVVPVVLAKEAVYRSMYGREMHEQDIVDAPSSVQLESLAFRAQDDLDATIARISGAYRLLGLEQGGSRGLDMTEAGGVRAPGSSFDFAFPPELSVALRRLYYLRRGPLLNPGPMRSLDDRAEIRSLFIRFPMEDCLCMMAPLLWRCEPSNDKDSSESAPLEEILPETLILWSNSVIAADNYHSIFVWSGSEVSDPQYDSLRSQCLSHLTERSELRFPLPQLHVVKENDSMSRRFTALLAPSHGDPIEHCLANFPALSRLSAQELETVRQKFKFYDAESDPSFRSWFWTVVGATSSTKDRGVSLCE